MFDYSKRNAHISNSAKQVKRITFRPAILVFLLLLLAASPAKTAAALTDEEKKTIVYAMYQDYKQHDFPDIPDIHPKQALALWKAGKVVFVDTRSQTEMDISMLPDAIPQAVFLANPQLYHDKTVIAYCTISYRSGKFTQEMKKQKMNMVNLVGGILAWVLEGGKIYNTDGATKQIHVYGEQWDYPASGYTSVKFGFFEKWFGS